MRYSTAVDNSSDSSLETGNTPTIQVKLKELGHHSTGASNRSYHHHKKYAEEKLPNVVTSGSGSSRHKCHHHDKEPREKHYHINHYHYYNSPTNETFAQHQLQPHPIVPPPHSVAMRANSHSTRTQAAPVSVSAEPLQNPPAKPRTTPTTLSIKPKKKTPSSSHPIINAPLPNNAATKVSSYSIFPSSSSSSSLISFDSSSSSSSSSSLHDPNPYYPKQYRHNTTRNPRINPSRQAKVPHPPPVQKQNPPMSSTVEPEGLHRDATTIRRSQNPSYIQQPAAATDQNQNAPNKQFHSIPSLEQLNVQEFGSSVLMVRRKQSTRSIRGSPIRQFFIRLFRRRSRPRFYFSKNQLKRSGTTLQSPVIKPRSKIRQYKIKSIQLLNFRPEPRTPTPTSPRPKISQPQHVRKFSGLFSGGREVELPKSRRSLGASQRRSTTGRPLSRLGSMASVHSPQLPILEEHNNDDNDDVYSGFSGVGPAVTRGNTTASRYTAKSTRQHQDPLDERLEQLQNDLNEARELKRQMTNASRLSRKRSNRSLYSLNSNSSLYRRSISRAKSFISITSSLASVNDNYQNIIKRADLLRGHSPIPGIELDPISKQRLSKMDEDYLNASVKVEDALAFVNTWSSYLRRAIAVRIILRQEMEELENLKLQKQQNDWRTIHGEPIVKRNSKSTTKPYISRNSTLASHRTSSTVKTDDDTESYTGDTETVSSFRSNSSSSTHTSDFNDRNINSSNTNHSTGISRNYSTKSNQSNNKGSGDTHSSLDTQKVTNQFEKTRRYGIHINDSSSTNFVDDDYISEEDADDIYEDALSPTPSNSSTSSVSDSPPVPPPHKSPTSFSSIQYKTHRRTASSIKRALTSGELQSKYSILVSPESQSSQFEPAKNEDEWETIPESAAPQNIQEFQPQENISSSVSSASSTPDQVSELPTINVRRYGSNHTTSSVESSALNNINRHISDASTGSSQSSAGTNDTFSTPGKESLWIKSRPRQQQQPRSMLTPVPGSTENSPVVSLDSDEAKFKKRVVSEPLVSATSSSVTHNTASSDFNETNNTINSTSSDETVGTVIPAISAPARQRAVSSPVGARPNSRQKIPNLLAQQHDFSELILEDVNQEFHELEVRASQLLAKSQRQLNSLSDDIRSTESPLFEQSNQTWQQQENSSSSSNSSSPQRARSANMHLDRDEDYEDVDDASDPSTSFTGDASPNLTDLDASNSPFVTSKASNSALSNKSGISSINNGMLNRKPSKLEMERAISSLSNTSSNLFSSEDKGKNISEGSNHPTRTTISPPVNSIYSDESDTSSQFSVLPLKLTIRQTLPHHIVKNSEAISSNDYVLHSPARAEFCNASSPSSSSTAPAAGIPEIPTAQSSNSGSSSRHSLVSVKSQRIANLPPLTLPKRATTSVNLKGSPVPRQVSRAESIAEAAAINITRGRVNRRRLSPSKRNSLSGTSPMNSDSGSNNSSPERRDNNAATRRYSSSSLDLLVPPPAPQTGDLGRNHSGSSTGTLHSSPAGTSSLDTPTSSDTKYFDPVPITPATASSSSHITDGNKEAANNNTNSSPSGTPQKLIGTSWVKMDA